MNFCSHCGNPVEWRVPPDDNRPRWCCGSCGAIHYENPRIVLGTIPVWNDQVLLCRRAIEPRKGFWTLPAGFMENGETIAQGAMRETDEEAKAQVKLCGVFSVIDVPHVHQVHIFYRADLVDGKFAPGPESLDVQLFDEHSIPWSELAFRTVEVTLKAFFADRCAGMFGLHSGVVGAALERAG